MTSKLHPRFFTAEEQGIPMIQEPSALSPSHRTHASFGLTKAMLIQFSRPAPLRILANVLMEWLLIVLTIVLAHRIDQVWCTVLAVAFIGTRQHALLVLMHEFSHRNFSRTRPLLNDTVGDFLTALPHLITVYGFRRDHKEHHLHTSTAQDPNWVSARKKKRFQFPKTRPQLGWELIKHCLGIYAMQEIKSNLFDAKLATDMPRAVKIRQTVFMVLVLIVAWAFNLWAILAIYWLLPLLTMLVGPLQKWLIAPHGVLWHTEHHLYPSVPFCRLSALHRELMRHADYADQILLTRGYFSGLWKELCPDKVPYRDKVDSP